MKWIDCMDLDIEISELGLRFTLPLLPHTQIISNKENRNQSVSSCTRHYVQSYVMLVGEFLRKLPNIFNWLIVVTYVPLFPSFKMFD